MQSDLYKILGVEKTVSQSVIKKAYRKLAKKLHPDAGGSPEDFKALVVAYNILYDPEKRARYDKGESVDEIHKKERSENELIYEVILSLFMGLMNSPRNIKTTNIPKEITSAINRNMNDIKEQIESKKQGIERFNQALCRFSTKAQENIFEKACLSQIEILKNHKIGLEKQLEIGEKAKIFLNAYDYKIDPDVMAITYESLARSALDQLRVY